MARVLVTPGLAIKTLLWPPLTVTFTGTTLSEWFVVMKKESSLSEGKYGWFSMKPTKNSFPSFVYTVAGRSSVG